MKTILQLNSSIYSNNGESSRLASEFVQALRDGNPGATVITRDLASEPLPHLDAERFGAFGTPAEQRTEQQRAIVAESDELIDELRQADVVVLGLPMYNFSIPSQLKAWFDHVARAGVTFRYTDKGPVGLLKGKKAYVFATRGGLYAGTANDTQTPYLRQFLGFLGISEVEVTYAEGLAYGAPARESSLAKARVALQNLVAPTALAA